MQSAVLRDSRAIMYVFQTGTDEHGQKIELKAKEAGIEPKEYVDKVLCRSKTYLGYDGCYL